MHFITLGHSPDLSLLELQSRGIKTTPIDRDIVSTSNSDIVKIAPELAGITRVLEQVQTTTSETALSDLETLVRDSDAKNHAISNYSNLKIDPHDLYQLRTRVKKTRPVRFLNFDTVGHSLIALRKKHVAEFSLIQSDSDLVIARTIWIQDADAWSHRDRSRPYQDITRGMLPPKIARLMVNLATQGKSGKLLDPFCGTGTILMEASLLGNQVIGSDNDPSAVEGAKNNLDWLSSLNQVPGTTNQVLLSDATHVDRHVDSVDYIVTEPYLGPLLSRKNLPPHQKILNIARGLDKLYRGAIRSWSKVLVSGGRAVMVIPEFHIRGVVIPTLKIDTIASLGYNYTDSVAYSKPGAIVVRNITILTKSQ